MKAAILLASACSLATAEIDRKEKQQLERELTGAVRNVGIDILSQSDLSKNAVISPLSIVGAMYMLAAGTAGYSRMQILEALNFTEVFEYGTSMSIDDPFITYKNILDHVSTPEDYILKLANGMFYQDNSHPVPYNPNAMRPEYIDILKEGFIRDISNIEAVDFKNDALKTTKRINRWVSDNTEGHISELFKQPLESDSLVVLASTLFFKASWLNEFEELEEEEKQDVCFSFRKPTRGDDDFCKSTGIEWMKKVETLRAIRIPGVGWVIDMPLGTKPDSKVFNKMMMQIWLPEGTLTTKEEDNAFLKKMSRNIRKVRKGMGKPESRKIIMPKFDISFDKDLKDAFQNMGIVDVFGPSADLSPMLGENQRATVSKVNHATKFKVDEKGVVGAAATSITIKTRGEGRDTRIDINRPFYFVVNNMCMEKSGNRRKNCPYSNIPLFMGKVSDPSTD